VTPDEKDLARIQRDALMVKQSRQLVSSRTDFLSGFVRPLNGPVTGVYGSQRVYNGVPGSPHYGIDYAAPTGTLVAAPAPGRVIFAHPDLFYSGGTLIIDHGFGLSSTFLHLSEILVTKGDEVARGESVAKVGATGRATGPHLDWRMNWRDVRVDPQLVLKALPAG
jgi:murein DD-endopeptidase MepM/ murein hydrolase activator NlpD